MSNGLLSLVDLKITMRFCHPFMALENNCTGCTGGLGRGKLLSNGIGSGGGHGGKGGAACFNDDCIEGGISYGSADLPCELGSGSGNESSAGATAGGGIVGKLISGSKMGSIIACC